MWRTGWGLVSGEWDDQQKIGWCGRLDGGKCLESGTTSRRSADVEDWMGHVSGEWDDQQKIGWCGGLDGGKCLENGTNSRRSAYVERPTNAATSGNVPVADYESHRFLSHLGKMARRSDSHGRAETERQVARACVLLSTAQNVQLKTVAEVDDDVHEVPVAHLKREWWSSRRKRSQHCNVEYGVLKVTHTPCKVHGVQCVCWCSPHICQINTKLITFCYLGNRFNPEKVIMIFTKYRSRACYIDYNNPWCTRNMRAQCIRDQQSRRHIRTQLIMIPIISLQSWLSRVTNDVSAKLMMICMPHEYKYSMIFKDCHLFVML